MSSARRPQGCPCPGPGARGNPLIGGSVLPARLRGVSQRRGPSRGAAGGIRASGHTQPSRAATPPQILAGRRRGHSSFISRPRCWCLGGCSLLPFRLSSFTSTVSPVTRTPASGPVPAFLCGLRLQADLCPEARSLLPAGRPEEAHGGRGRLGRALLSPLPRCFRLGSFFAKGEGSRCLTGRKVYVISLYRSFAGQGGLREVILC